MDGSGQSIQPRRAIDPLAEVGLQPFGNRDGAHPSSAATASAERSQNHPGAAPMASTTTAATAAAASEAPPVRSGSSSSAGANQACRSTSR